jgi:hypothetical protein
MSGKRKSTATERKRADAANRRAMERIAAERVAAGKCRHCGGPLPCQGYAIRRATA